MSITQKRAAWHSIGAHELHREFEVDVGTGLTDENVVERRKTYGDNRISPPRTDNFAEILLHQFKNPLIIILVSAGAISIFLGEKTDALVIGITVLANTIIGAFQEGKATKAFSALQKHLTHQAVVLRDRKERQVGSEEVVPGDVIVLRAGDYVPADARIIQSRNLRVNESVLTGEWLPVDKAENILKAGVPLAERVNMLFAGTLIESGSGRALVVNTAMNTEFGRISELVVETSKAKTPLQKSMESLAKIISILAIALVVLIFFLGIWRGESITEMFILAVAVAVAVVPEGLPIALTVILALGMERILKAGGLVKKLVAAETLGSTSIILTDKTGTLTQARMQVSAILTEKEEDHLTALRIGMSTSDAFIENPEADFTDWKIRGESTDQALLLAGIQAGLNPKELFAESPRIDFLPFESERRFAASLSKGMLYISGSPEVVLANSTLTQKKLAVLQKQYEDATLHGQRVLAVAYKKTPADKIPLEDGDFYKKLTFVGFISFHDPLREDVKESIALAKQAGLRPIIITGDHKLTARKIAEEIGIDVERQMILEGPNLEEMSQETLQEKVGQVGVYARVLPHQKLRIVKAWQASGAVVAMTGDGVNDAPALKRADVGVALGSGTEVAKEAADIVLLDDSFTVLLRAIEEGRVILDNLRKVITFVFATGFTELILIGGALLIGFPLPVHAIQILWTNIVGEGLLNFAYAFEPKESDVMKQHPDRRRKILTREMWFLIFIIGIATDLILFALYFYLLKKGYPLERTRTLMFAGLALNSLFFAYSLRSLRQPIWKISFTSNPFFLVSMVVSIALLASAFFIPPLQRLLLLVPISWNEVGIIIGLGIINLFLIEIGKWIFISRKLTE